MKYLMIVSSMALGLAVPALAQDQQPAPKATNQQESVQPPTNRIDKLVPNMKGPNDSATSNDSSAGAATGEGEHPPTNRVGKAVPEMKSPNAADDLPAEQPAEPAESK
jgi:hypothetical protein